MTNPRLVKQTKVTGYFGLPIGLSLFRREEVPSAISAVKVSTVCRDGAHLEDPLGMLDPETGYETMVFLDGCRFFPVFTAEYQTREEAIAGHEDVVKRLIDGALPLAIQIKNYAAHSDGAVEEAA